MLKDLAQRNFLRLIKVGYDYPTIGNSSFNKNMHSCYNQNAVRYFGGTGAFTTLDCDLQNLDHRAIEELYHNKNPAFREESEWRLLGFTETLNEKLGAEYRHGPNGFSSFTRVRLPKNAIKMVTMGPNHPTERRTIERILHSCDISADVRRSGASYRG